MDDDAAQQLRNVLRSLTDRKPGQLLGKGHPIGDFLEAHEWSLLDEQRGLLHIRAHLPEHVRNLRGQMFGGFTPTYVDLVAVFTVHAGERRHGEGLRAWLATTSMRVDYFEPICGPEFLMESRLIKKRGRTNFVETRFLDPDGTLLVFATTTLREVPIERA